MRQRRVLRFGQRGEEVGLRAGVDLAVLQRAQPALGVADHRGRDAGQRGDLDAVALARGAFFERVQEDDAVAVLDRVQVHVGALGVVGVEAGELEVVGGEQRQRARLLQQVAGDREGEREPVEGRGTAADLVHQHQAALGGAVQDGGGLGHLDHEGGAPGGEVVRGADAGEDRVERAELGGVRRHEAADVGEQADERDLAHERRFAAHVGAGDHQHAAGGGQARVVADEVLDLALDHRMAAADDVQAWGVDEARLHVAVAQRGLGQRGEAVEQRERARDALQRRDVRREHVEHLVEEELFACQRALVGRQRLVLEGLELGRDVALGVL